MNKTKNKVLMVATDWNNPGRNGKLGGVTYYRLQKPKQYLEELGYEVDLYGKEFSSQFSDGTEQGHSLMEKYAQFIKGYDVVVSKVIDNKYAAAALIGACRQAETPLIVDIDDNFLEVLPSQPAYNLGYKDGDEPKAFASAFVSRADALFVSTQPLKDYFSKWMKEKWGEDKDIFLLPNCCDPDDWVKAKQGGDIIGWQGSITHNEDLEIIVPDLVEIAEKYPKVKFEFVGGFSKESAVEVFKNVPDWFFKRLQFVQGTLGFEGFPELMGERNWLCGLCPLVDNEFNRGKSHIKWMEYSQIGFPTIASAVYPYKEDIQGTKTIEHGVTGYLTDNWFDTLDYVLSHKRDIKAVAKKAREYTADKWHYKNHIHKWDEAISKVLSK